MSNSKQVKGGKGYLLIDNRASGGKLVELATLTCIHCNTIYVLNPERKKRRGYCKRCHAYICDAPGCNFDCNPTEECVELAHRYNTLGEYFLSRGKKGEVLFNTNLRDKHRIH